MSTTQGDLAQDGVEGSTEQAAQTGMAQNFMEEYELRLSPVVDIVSHQPDGIVVEGTAGIVRGGKRQLADRLDEVDRRGVFPELCDVVQAMKQDLGARCWNMAIKPSPWRAYSLTGQCSLGLHWLLDAADQCLSGQFFFSTAPASLNWVSAVWLRIWR